ncbi:Adenylate-forming reductase Nps11 [Psilocybe cubensis]|uniref:Carrier domain-containing protein n=2 Tax=Psilocybe cubensis TaxID=181762 RepID=A0A8H8CED7_PSICU|nr:Adenylate-forming reductase Nps11 [Psilocybe cubensis]KAH9482033.1 Adenylate-forming reductase Nps11 [Psilocybe cubensis]
MFGRERNQAGVLIELKPAYAIDPTNEDDLVAARNALWPIVEEANKVAPAFSRIFKEMILIASPNKPLPRAGKGMVMRKAALEVYAQEIDDIYAEVDDAAESDSAVLPMSWDVDGVIEWLKEQIEDIQSSDSEDTPFSVSEDFFAQGMDSLSATILRRRIVGAMFVASSSGSHFDNDSEAKTLKAAQLITQTTIYAHPSIEKLAAFVAGVVQDPERFVAVASRADAVDAMVGKYTVGLGETATHKAGSSLGSAPVDKGNMVVLLTGSTGNLGAQILESLLRDGRVQKVYALDRPASVSLSQRQAERFEDKLLDVTLLSSSKLVPLECDAAQRNLGAAQEVYDELRSSVTTIIHNAWKLDFNQSLSSFEPNVRATRNLVALARSSAHTASLRFVFTSSISSAASWDQSLGAYPEEIVLDSRYAVGNGYGESKYVAERILAQSGLNATSLRIGQITGGAPNGAWATSDW